MTKHSREKYYDVVDGHTGNERGMDRKHVRDEELIKQNKEISTAKLEKRKKILKAKTSEGSS